MASESLLNKVKPILDALEELENRFNTHADDKRSSMMLLCVEEARLAMQRAWELRNE